MRAIFIYPRSYRRDNWPPRGILDSEEFTREGIKLIDTILCAKSDVAEITIKLRRDLLRFIANQVRNSANSRSRSNESIDMILPWQQSGSRPSAPCVQLPDHGGGDGDALLGF